MVASTVPRRNIKLNRIPTGITIEDIFWDYLREAATLRNCTIHELATQIAQENSSQKAPRSLSSALRLWTFQDLLRRIKSISRQKGD